MRFRINLARTALKEAVRFAHQSVNKQMRKQRHGHKSETTDQPIEHPRKFQPIQAPVIIFHVGRRILDVEKMCRLFDQKSIIYRVCDVENDQPNREAIIREAQGKSLPCVFIGGDPVGGEREILKLLISPHWKSIFYPKEII